MLGDWRWNELDDPDSRLAQPAWAVFCHYKRKGALRRQAEAPVLKDEADLTWAVLADALPPAIRCRIPPDTPLFKDPNLLIRAAEASLSALRIRQESWREACSRMGASKAALCIAVMAAKQETTEPIRAPGRYLAELVARDGRGELKLGLTLQAMVRRSCQQAGT